MQGNDINDTPKPWEWKVGIFCLLFAMAFLFFRIGTFYACADTGKLIDGKCYSVIDVGYCVDSAENKYYVNSSINYTRIAELNNTE